MKIAITGSSGLVGKALVEAFEKRGDRVFRIVRDKHQEGEKNLFFDYSKDWNFSVTNLAFFENFDAFINLAGENIGKGRWTKEKKKKIYESRIHTTKNISSLLSQLKNPPKVFINASAIGIYGDRGAEVLTEESIAGRGFLATVCKAWEKVALEANLPRSRVVLLRIGAVLSNCGGMFSKMLPIFKWGFGGKLGSGDQFLSFVTLHDLVKIILFLIEKDSITGAINCVSPYPVTNKEFTNTFGALLRRRAFFTLPRPFLKFVFGEMADDLMFASERVYPEKLLMSGFKFDFETINEALEFLIKNENQ